jgi:hypothetical protein
VPTSPAHHGAREPLTKQVAVLCDRKLADGTCDYATIEFVNRAPPNRVGAPSTCTQNDLNFGTTRIRSKTTEHADSSKTIAEQNRGLLAAWSVGPADAIGVTPCRLGCKCPYGGGP